MVQPPFVDTTATKPRGRPRKITPPSQPLPAASDVAAGPAVSTTSLADYELTGMIAEAWEAYDMDRAAVRFDSRARRWAFEADREELRLQVGSLTDRVSIDILKSDLGKPMVAEAVRALDIAA